MYKIPIQYKGDSGTVKKHRVAGFSNRGNGLGSREMLITLAFMGFLKKPEAYFIKE